MPRKTNAKNPRTKATSEGIAPTVTVSEEPKAKAKDVGGRPSDYSEELGETICGLLITRDEEGKTMSLRAVSQMDGMPHEATIYRWIIAHENFREMYTRAKDILADMNAEDVVYIADTEKDANLARVRIDARKWWASKVSPKKYSDKLALSGDGDGAPIQHQVGVSWMTEEQAKARGWA